MTKSIREIEWLGIELLQKCRVKYVIELLNKKREKK